MSAEVVDLNSRRPHRVGPARCRGCGHEEKAVVSPLDGPLPMECPACHESKFWYMGVIDPGGLRWECGQCGNDLFFITPAGAHCAFCDHVCVPDGWACR